jgi:hypothetical protein
MINMLCAAKRTGFIESHLRIQRLVTGPVDDHAPVFQDAEIRALKHPILSRADKNKFQLLCRHRFIFSSANSSTGLKYTYIFRYVKQDIPIDLGHRLGFPDKRKGERPCMNARGDIERIILGVQRAMALFSFILAA